MSTTHQLGILSDPGIAIPSDVSFAALKLQLWPDDVVRFDKEMLRRVWVESGYPDELLDAAEELEVCRFIARWYAEHMRAGGASHPMHVHLVAFLLGRKPTTLRIQPL
jgi:hypothetical protein